MNSVSDWSPAERAAIMRTKAPRSGSALALVHSHSALGGDDWVDALDPRLPAEPLLSCPQLQKSSRASSLWLHKLILLGVALGAGAFAFGYFAAAWLL